MTKKAAVLSIISLSVLSFSPFCRLAGQSGPESHPLYDPVLAEAARLMMEVRLERADSLITGWIERNPERPAGYFFRSANCSWRIFLRPRDADIGPLRDRFEKANKDCRRVAELAAKRRESRFEGLLYLGAIYGQDALLALIDHRYLIMAPLARQAWNYIGRTLAIDSLYYDSYFGKGMYQYFTAVLPGPVQLMAAAYGFEPDREGGLANIRLAAERGLYAREAAEVMLLNIYSNIEQPDDYVEELARSQYERFPDNPHVHWRCGDILLRRQKYDQAIPLFEAVAGRIESNFPYYRNQMFSEFSIAFRLGLCYRKTGRTQEALAQFGFITSSRKVFPDWVVPEAWLAEGEILFDQGQLARADSCLKKVLELEDFQDSRKRAGKLREEIRRRR